MSNKFEGAERADDHVSEERLALLYENLQANKISLPPELLEQARVRVVTRRQERSRENLEKQGRLPVDPHGTTVPSIETQSAERAMELADQQRYMGLIDRKTTIYSRTVVREALLMADGQGLFDNLDLGNDTGEKSQVRASRDAIRNI